MRYKAVISYFGRNYVGWQRQLNGVSVQQRLEEALSKIFSTPTQATASGRTDAGVHAEGQVVHFDADTSIPTEKIAFAVNTCLPDDISMLSCEVAEPDFNARFNAKKKTYCYKLYLSHFRRPMLEQTHAHITVPLNLDAVREAADIIQGTHDFKCFEASGSVIKNTVRTVYGIDIKTNPLRYPLSDTCDSAGNGDKSGFCDDNAEKSDSFNNSNRSNDADNGQLNSDSIKNSSDCPCGGAKGAFDCEVCISVTGNGFLYNMVRIIAGTLVYVGIGKLSPQDVADIIESGDRKMAGKTLPAQGLHLISVIY